MSQPLDVNHGVASQEDPDPLQSAGRVGPASGETPPIPALSDPAGWVDEHGDYLYSFAMLRLRDPAEAQDVVQETLLAALKSKAPYAGRTVERGWLLGILKNKINDVHRRANREVSFTELGFYESQESERFVSEGLQRGAWADGMGPKDWAPKAGASLDQDSFWEAFRQCSGKLPKAVCQVFLMRELEDIKTRDICATLKISQANVWVMLHRARMALRQCLEQNWFTR